MFVFDLINFLVGTGVGLVVAVVSPKVYKAVTGEVAVVEAKAKSVANTVSADVKKL